MELSVIKDLFTRKNNVNKEDDTESNLRSTGVMLCLAFAAGIFGGFGSIFFKYLIGAIVNSTFYGEFNIHVDPDAHLAQSKWGAFIIAVPVLASFVVTWITKTFSPESRGHGVPEVLNAIYHVKGKIRPQVVLSKAIVSAISIGTGGSVGREGPIIQIGSAFGSLLGQIIKMPARQRITLIAAGAAAGIAATFNAPIGGLVFAMELLLVSISARTVVLVAISTVTATYIGRVYFGLAPSFNIPRIAIFEDHYIRMYSLLFCIPLGIIVGFAASLFIKSIYKFEDLFNSNFKNDYIRHAIGMFMVGIILYLFMRFSGHYYVDGVVYATIIDTLKGTITNPMFLGLLLISKLFLTSVTLGSGASGGVFAPSLFLGSILGALFGNLVYIVFPAMGNNIIIYTIAGMAAMVGGTTGAVITAVVMTFEQTRDYGAILPIILTVSIAHLVRTYLCHESIYTLKLVRRGSFLPQGLTSSSVVSLRAKKVMNVNFAILDIEKIEEWRSNYLPSAEIRYTLVSRNDNVVGIVREDLLYAFRDREVSSIIDDNIGFVLDTTRWPVILRTMRARSTDFVAVVKQASSKKVSDVIGVITSKELIVAEENEADLME